MAFTLRDVPLKRVSDRAHAASPGTVLLAAVTWILLNAGWLAARILRICWLALAWTFAAFAEGFTAGWASDQRRRPG